MDFLVRRDRMHDVSERSQGLGSLLVGVPVKLSFAYTSIGLYSLSYLVFGLLESNVKPRRCKSP